MWQFEELYDIQPLDDTEYGYSELAQKQWNESVNHNLWSEFEKSIGQPNIESMFDLSASVTEGMPDDGIRDHMAHYWKKQFGYIEKLQGFVKEWIETFTTDNIAVKKNSLVNSSDYFLNFNYTDLLENVYKVENVLHIHGAVSSISDINPIMGHCNKKDMMNHKQWAKDAYEEFKEAESSIQEAIYNYLSSTYKDTDEQIRFNKQFFEKIRFVKEVIIFGWSAGEVDIPYLRKIIENVDENTKWTIYYYDDTAYDSLKKAFQQEGYDNNSNTEYIDAKKFWD